MYFYAQFFIGAALMFVGWSVWYAQRNDEWKRKLEKIFLLPGDKLFDKGKGYSGYVTWLRYVAFVAGLTIIVPTAIVWDVIVGMIALFVFWLMSTQKIEHDDRVRRASRTDPEQSETV